MVAENSDWKLAHFAARSTTVLGRRWPAVVQGEREIRTIIQLTLLVINAFEQRRFLPGSKFQRTLNATFNVRSFHWVLFCHTVLCIWTCWYLLTALMSLAAKFNKRFIAPSLILVPTYTCVHSLVIYITIYALKIQVCFRAIANQTYHKQKLLFTKVYLLLWPL